MLPLILSLYSFTANELWFVFDLRSGQSLQVFPSGSEGKESACNAGDLGLIPALGRFPWRREWQPTPAFLPGEFYGQEKPTGLQSMESQRVRHDWATNTHTTIRTASVIKVSQNQDIQSKFLHHTDCLWNVSILAPWKKSYDKPTAH